MRIVLTIFKVLVLRLDIKDAQFRKLLGQLVNIESEAEKTYFFVPRNYTYLTDNTFFNIAGVGSICGGGEGGGTLIKNLIVYNVKSPVFIVDTSLLS
jgi:hypothetical protein